jgi:hypothetical protein
MMMVVNCGLVICMCIMDVVSVYQGIAELHVYRPLFTQAVGSPCDTFSLVGRA